jgi:hypothetical protein
LPFFFIAHHLPSFPPIGGVVDNQLRFRRRRLDPFEAAALPTRGIGTIALLALALELWVTPTIGSALDVRLEVVDRQDVEH